jgi:dihydroneopterin aldolase
MDQVYIDALKVETLIGVYEFERKAQQTLYLDLALDFDCLPAGETDELTKALDYDALAKRVRQWSSEQTFELLESFGHQLCQLIHDEFGIAAVSLRINKPAAVEGCAAAGIKIKRRYSIG